MPKASIAPGKPADVSTSGMKRIEPRASCTPIMKDALTNGYAPSPPRTARPGTATTVCERAATRWSASIP
jgi:hypothetical protein